MALYVSVLKEMICPKESAVQNRLGKEIQLSSFHTEKKWRNCYGDFPKIMREVCENGAYFH